MELQSLKKKNLYRGPSSSKEFNEQMNDIQTDVVRLYDLLNANEESIQASSDILLREYQFSQKQVEDLKREVESLRTLKESLLAGERKGKSIKLLGAPNEVMDGEESKRVFQDLDYGILSPDLSDISSKVSFVTESGNVVVSDNMTVSVKESDNTKPFDEENNTYVYHELDDDGFKNMVDKQKETYWTRTVRFGDGSGVRKVMGEVHIKLATEKLTNLYANAMTIRPFPEGSMTLTDIHVRGNGGAWSRLESFPEENGEPIAIPDSKRMLFAFGRTEVAEIKIRFEQPYWFEADGQREFTYGFQDIDVEYRSYTENECEFVTEHVLDGERYFEQIERPVVVNHSGEKWSGEGLVEHQLYYDKGLSSEFGFGEEILAPLKKVYVRTRIKRVGESVPILRRLEMDYRFKEKDEI